MRRGGREARLLSDLYVESSAFLTLVLEGDARLATAFMTARLVASPLTVVESHRGITRAALEGRLTGTAASEAARWLANLEGRCAIIQLDATTVLEAKRVFPIEPVRSLDAIHLASALIWNREVGPARIASLDRRIRANAQALGLEVLPA